MVHQHVQKQNKIIKESGKKNKVRKTIEKEKCREISRKHRKEGQEDNSVIIKHIYYTQDKEKSKENTIEERQRKKFEETQEGKQKKTKKETEAKREGRG